MSEGKQLVAGELILGEARTAARERNEAIETLVRDHARLAYRVAYAVLRNHQDAEDAVQEAFVRVLRYVKRLESVENPKTWLARIAWRVAVDRSKRHRQRNEVPLVDNEKPLREMASGAVTPDAAADAAKIAAALEKMIAALPAKLREPLILSMVEEMTPRDTAAVLGISEAAVRSRAFRARQILREKLAGLIGCI